MGGKKTFCGLTCAEYLLVFTFSICSLQSRLNIIPRSMVSDLLPRRGGSGGQLPHPVMDKINEREPFIPVTFVNTNVSMFLHTRLVQRTENNKYVIKMADFESSF